MLAISPAKFEELVGAVLRGTGYANIRVEGRPSDGGVDILAWRNAPEGPRRIIVQCKRYASAVGVKAARELAGVVAGHPECEHGLLVAVSGFTPACRQFVAESGGKVQLMDGSELTRHMLALGLEA